MQSLNDAARLAASSYPGGLAALCVRMAWSYESARKELAGAPGFKLGASRIQQIHQLCTEAGSPNADAIAIAMLGPEYVKADTGRNAAASLMAATVNVVQHSAELLASVTSARADGVVSDNERRHIEREATKVIQDMHAVLAEVAHENELAHMRAVK